MTTEKEVIDQFIIQVTLIEPINKIVTGLKKNSYRDCDIKWLDMKLEKFTSFACVTLGLKAELPEPIKGKVLNDYTSKQYLDRFTTLVKYFESFNK